MADEELIERTKRQMRKLVAEIADLSKRDIDVGYFYPNFLARVISALAANGGAVWMLSGANALELAYQFKLPAVLRGEDATAKRHSLLLQHTLVRDRGIVVQLHSGEVDGVQPCNPTNFLLVLAVLKADRAPQGVAIRSGRLLASGFAQLDQFPTGIVEIFQRPGAPSTTQRGYLKFLGQMCELANDYLRRSSPGR